LCVKRFLRRRHAVVAAARLDSGGPEHLISGIIQSSKLALPARRFLALLLSAGGVLACIFLDPAPAVPLTPPPAASEDSSDLPAPGIARFDLPRSGLELERPTRPGAFFDVVGRRSAVFGYENRAFEAWAYPLKLVDDFKLAFRIEGYPLDFSALDTRVAVTVRPEATIFTHSHAGFTVREIVFAPLDEPGIVILLDVRSVLPLTVIGSFRPRLRLMWPAGLMTGDLGWDEKQRVYSITEETKRFAAIVGSPAARDLAVMPYQEEPRDVPIRFAVDVRPEDMGSSYIPIVIAGGVDGRDGVKATYDRLLQSARSLYENNVAHYRALQERTVSVTTPDERLDTAFAWAKVGVDKGLATNPLLGTGLLAGFRTSGESERPGFAWMFGRDALWTALAIHSYGDFPVARTALEFLRSVQRADGKIPHEISQSAGLIPWFTEYKYPWESADATPLYVIVQADHWRATGDLAFLRESWPSIVKAWRFSAGTDTDNNGLIENTRFGHGWTEGSPPYPPHEEIYLQGIWVEACRAAAELADVMADAELASSARAFAERARAAIEGTYWLPSPGFYAFATALPKPEKVYNAEPGPRRAERQARIEALRGRTLVDEDTVLPAVPLWWRVLDGERAQAEIDHLGAASLGTDWGARLISAHSQLYDPLSYHYGSVWPLFTGWASVGAYRYGRPHVGYQALMANALLTFQGALGYVTELLSGDLNAPFGRSSHHQVWSEAMVVSPLLRGMLGIEAAGGGRSLTFAPQLPGDWDRVAVRNVPAGESRFDLSLSREPGVGGDAGVVSRDPGVLTIVVQRRGPDPSASEPSIRALQGGAAVVLAPAFPLDARVRSVTMDGRQARFEIERRGDVQRAVVTVPAAVPGAAGPVRVVFTYDEGTEVYAHIDPPERGAASEGLRILRARAEPSVLRLTLEGLAGRTYALGVRSPHAVGGAPGVTAKQLTEAIEVDRPDRHMNGRTELSVTFDGPMGQYVRRTIDIPLR
jgi:glycogen debranching enzyme